MGWVSKREDEIEKRNGNEPRQALRRFSTILCELRFEPEVAARQPSLGWDEAATIRFRELVAKAERSLEKRNNAVGGRAKHTVDFNATKRFLKAHKAFAEDISELVRFLAPRVLKMRDGPEKRRWQKIIRQLKKARTFG